MKEQAHKLAVQLAEKLPLFSMVTQTELSVAEKVFAGALEQAALRYEQLYPASEYHEDMGNVLWWHLPVCEPPVVGRGDDDAVSFDGWYTHFSRMPIVWDGDGSPKHPVSGGHHA